RLSRRLLVNRRSLRPAPPRRSSALDAAAGEHRSLDDHLRLGTAVEPAADLRVLALVVLAHDVEIDLLGRPAGEGARHAAQHADRPQRDILMELPADRDEQAPERDVVGHAGPVDGAEIDRIMALDPLEPVLRHHAAGLDEALAGPVEALPGELDSEPAAGGLHHPDALVHHLVADPVAGDDGDLVLGHWRVLLVPYNVS